MQAIFGVHASHCSSCFNPKYEFRAEEEYDRNYYQNRELPFKSDEYFKANSHWRFTGTNIKSYSPEVKLRLSKFYYLKVMKTYSVLFFLFLI